MTETLDDYKACSGFNPACHNCEFRCCWIARWKYAPPPLLDDEVERIAARVGHRRFIAHNEGFPVLALHNGNCVFLNTETHECEIYTDRPTDCRLFPFDFYTVGDRELFWVIWDCAYSRAMSDEQIAEDLRRIEQEHSVYIRRIWSYGDSDYVSEQQLRRERPFRVLRTVELPPEK